MIEEGALFYDRLMEWLERTSEDVPERLRSGSKKS